MFKRRPSADPSTIEVTLLGRVPFTYGIPYQADHRPLPAETRMEITEIDLATNQYHEVLYKDLSAHCYSSQSKAYVVLSSKIKEQFIFDSVRDKRKWSRLNLMETAGIQPMLTVKHALFNREPVFEISDQCEMYDGLQLFPQSVDGVADECHGRESSRKIDNMFNATSHSLFMRKEESQIFKSSVMERILNGMRPDYLIQENLSFVHLLDTLLSHRSWCFAYDQARISLPRAVERSFNAALLEPYQPYYDQSRDNHSPTVFVPRQQTLFIHPILAIHFFHFFNEINATFYLHRLILRYISENLTSLSGDDLLGVKLDIQLFQQEYKLDDPIADIRDDMDRDGLQAMISAVEEKVWNQHQRVMRSYQNCLAQRGRILHDYFRIPIYGILRAAESEEYVPLLVQLRSILNQKDITDQLGALQQFATLLHVLSQPLLAKRNLELSQPAIVNLTPAGIFTFFNNKVGELHPDLARKLLDGTINPTKR
ncbi:MAG: hypothetical protein KBD83_05345 [Gammaproteobacteria bacterium]|nr:hypothetical protein [Gammaproteobacteria bacterium]